MEQFVFFTDDPNHVTGLEGCVRGGVHGGGAVAFDADDETGGFITDAGFPDGVSHEWCVGLNGELFQADFRGRCCSSSCFRFSTRFSTNSRKTLISLSVAATMIWSKGYRRSSPPGMFIRSSPRMIVTTLTPQVWRKFNSFSVLPTLGEDCDTSKSARWRSRSSKCLTKRCLMGDLRSCSFCRAVKLRRKRRSSCIEYFFNRLE